MFVSVSVMEDLADEECVVPIFIRCLGHLYGDAKFGQIGDGGQVAGERRLRADDAGRTGRGRPAGGGIGPSGGGRRPPEPVGGTVPGVPGPRCGRDGGIRTDRRRTPDRSARRRDDGTDAHMPLDGEYEPSPTKWVRDQVELYESSGGTEGTTLQNTGLPVIVLTSRGARSGKIRKTPLMRVEQDGTYAVVASLGGAPKHPVWYFNVKADPHVELQDGPVRRDMTAREITGVEKAEWWERAVAAYPPYADYQKKTDREIPVFVLEPADEG
ncbi:hypothetical protein GCM10010220_50470 [Streptomyces parvulus]|nr:hypothetical protein GCM10010220_50470 [Streptomyces parvulus]